MSSVTLQYAKKDDKYEKKDDYKSAYGNAGSSDYTYNYDKVMHLGKSDCLASMEFLFLCSFM